jgi:hypothetical protein
VKRGILRTLGVIVTLALMLVAFPASVASALVSTIKIENVEGTEATNPYYGEARAKVGDAIRISGTGTSGNDLWIGLSNQNVDLGDEVDDELTTYEHLADALIVGLTETGSYIATVDVPSRLNDGADDLDALYGGVYYIYICIGSSPDISVKTPIYIDAASGTMDETEGPVGTQVEIECTGLAPEEEIEVYFDGVDITDDYVVDGDLETNDDGELELLVVEIPPEEYGEHELTVKGLESNAEVTFTFEIEPSIKLTPAGGQAGSTILVQGSGFDSRNRVNLYIGSTFITSTSLTDSKGNFSQQITIPSALTPANYLVLAEDEDDDDIAAQATFTVSLNSILTLSTNTGNVGDTVTVSGSNFTPGANITVMFDTTPRGTFTVDASGNFTADIQIPAAACGAHAIKVGAVEQAYTITPKMTMDKIQGIAGTTVTLTGTGFAATTAIAATFGSAAITLNPAITDANGGFVSSFTVPNNATGSYNIQVVAGSTQTASFTIVEPTLALSAASGNVDDTITVTGTNFGASKTITLTIDGVAVVTTPAPLSSNTTGGFTATFKIPSLAGGTHTLTASDGTASKTSQIAVTAKATITPDFGNVGTTVTVTGTGFLANSPVTIKYNGVALQSSTAMMTNPAGALSVTFTVPASNGGARAVEVSDGTNTVPLTFTMESTAPTKPSLTLPVSASQEKGIVTFDWTDSTDASMPVTYTLLIATDSGFTSLALTKAGLTASTYTLTEAETLSKLPDGGSYYWKVIAKDAANNTQASDVNTFVVGGGMPGWLMWVWIGIGVVVVFVFAIWLGRRLAYSSY